MDQKREKSNEDPIKDAPSGPSKAKDFLIVGIGASAGGIKALKEFFAEVPPDSGMAYVVILHLSPEFDSRLAEILQAICSIPVSQIQEERVKVEPDHVYVIPPNKSLAMADGHLALSPVESYEARRAPVDIFFRTLADSNDGRAVSVVLSGTGSDGSMGMRRIKENGGIVLVQDPKEAEYSDMPENSIAQGLVDFVLPVARIPAQIIHYRNQRGNIHIAVKKEEESKEEEHEAALRQIFTLLRVKTGHDFSNYKRATILRRIERRMNVRELSDLPAYATLITTDKEEPNVLLKELLISVTNFFRDHAAFEALEKAVFTKLFKDKTSEDTVRIWVAACATGEEAYSMAILCAEQLGSVAEGPKVQIFATDIDANALITAREGYYSNADVADVSVERLRKFFVKEGEGFRVRKELRETILFARHNIIKDPPFSHLDLATCRNLLIYLNRTAQTRVMETFHFALNPGGYLFLGTSETVDGSSDLYATIDREQCIFQSRSIISRRRLPVPELMPGTRIPEFREVVPVAAESRPSERVSLAGLHHQLLELYAAPSVLVNADYDIMHVSEGAARYIQLQPGEPSLNLLKTVRPELRLELRGALYSAVQNGIAVQLVTLPVAISGVDELVTITIKPVSGELESARGFLLVMFQKMELGVSDPDQLIHIATGGEPIARHLEEELLRTSSQLRQISQRYEVQTEEFKASNEELQAINEELRSAAEELETGKEELQSVNEELTTVNQELKIKIDELSQTNNDFKNLINATSIGTIFLDRSFGVNLFTPAAREIFNLIPGDYGRPLSDITNRLVGTDITADAEAVLQSLQPAELEVQTIEGNTYLMHIQPYRTSEDHISGVVVTFVNITSRKEAEESLRKSYEQTAEILESIKDGFYSVDADYNFVYMNRKAEEMIGIPPGSVIGKNCWEEFGTEQVEDSRAKFTKAMQDRKVVTYETYSHLMKHWVEVRLYPNKSGGLSCYFSDITERKNTEEALRSSEERLSAMFNQATVGVAQTNLAGMYISMNQRYADMLGYSEDELSGRSKQDFIHPEDLATNVRLLEGLVAGGAAFEVEKRYLRKGGSIVWLHNNVTLIRGRDGEAQSVLIISIDISSQKALEKQKDDFIAIASHELKTPLTSVKAYAEVLHYRFLKSADTDSATLVAKLDGQVDRLTSLVKDLLDTNRISEGRLSLDKKMFDLTALIEEVREMMRYTTRKHKLELDLTPLPPFFGDRERIGQILTNLLGNAIKYAPDSERIIIMASADEQQVSIRVQDFGKGLSEEAMKKVFERFYRAEDSNAAAYSGMGLGLYISSQIAVMHGGTITVESKQNGGATFQLVLPIQNEN